MRTFWKILTLDSGTYDGIKNDPRGLFTALKMFIVVGLILAIGQLTAISGIRQEKSVYQGLDEAAAALETTVSGSFIPTLISEPVEAFAQSLTELANVLESGQPPLGKQASQVIIVIGEWLASPFNQLAAWMAAAGFIFICAKLLGGQGSLREHMGLVLLAFAPQVLMIVGSFSFVPALQPVAGVFVVAAYLWSLAILVVALRQAHMFSLARAAGTIVLACVLVGASALITFSFWGVVAAGLAGWLL